jgi:hypothetical protein
MTFGAAITCIMIVMMAVSHGLIRQVDDRPDSTPPREMTLIIILTRVLCVSLLPLPHETVGTGR